MQCEASLRKSLKEPLDADKQKKEADGTISACLFLYDYEIISFPS